MYDVYPSVIAEHNSSLAQPPLVVVAPSSSDRSGNNHDLQEDGFTAYSTALSATIAIGNIILITNRILITKTVTNYLHPVFVLLRKLDSIYTLMLVSSGHPLKRYPCSINVFFIASRAYGPNL